MFVVFGTRGGAAAVDDRAGDVAQDAALQPVAQRRRAAPPPRQASQRAARAATPRPTIAGDVLRAGAPVALVASAGEDGREPHAAADPERADALGAVELVGRQRQQIHAERAHVHRHLADGLHGVGVEEGAAGVERSRPGRRPAGRCRSRCWRASPRRWRSPESSTAFERVGGDDAVGRSTGARWPSRSPRRARCRHVLSTASCSIVLRDKALAAARAPSASAAPRRAKLSASVPPAVKTTSAGSAPISVATLVRASSMRGLGLLAEGVDARRIAERRGQRLRHRGNHFRGRPASWRCDRSTCDTVGRS